VLACREGGTTLKQQAVLFRTSEPFGPLEIELTRRNIPFVKFGGLKFLDAAHVKDLLALLRWAENPRDRVAGFRVLQLLPGVRTGHGRQVLDAHGRPDPTRSARACRNPAPAARRRGLEGLVELVERLGKREGGWPIELGGRGMWYEPLMEAAYEDADGPQGRYPAARTDRRRLPEPRALPDRADARSARRDQRPIRRALLDEDFLILSTIHSAKGQEWKAVHVLNVVDGCMPSDLGTGSTHELEEERRLLYVAMTRARDELHLIVPQRFYVHQQASYGDKHVYAQRSRFITRAMLPLFDDMFWPAVKPAAINGLAAPAAPRIDVGAGLLAMWKK
jgi:DNA helicase-2/ATP-dependent DNA helicase PcrA